jgi:hypothetical protein
MKLRSLAAGTTFLGAVFVLGPFAMVELNGISGWPRWSSGVGRAAGGGLMFAGLVTVAYCASLFWRIGAGTPVPVEPAHGDRSTDAQESDVRGPGGDYSACFSRGNSLLLYAATYLAAIQRGSSGRRTGATTTVRDGTSNATQRVSRWIRSAQPSAKEFPITRLFTSGHGWCAHRRKFSRPPAAAVFQERRYEIA